jgi:hypothetical protein
MNHNKVNEAGYNEATKFGPSENNPPKNIYTQQVDFSNPNADKIDTGTTNKLSFKAKAQELVDKMYFSRRYKEGEDYIPNQALAHAKQCAFIAVEEILSMSIMNEYGLEFTKQYWEKIRRELIILIGTDENGK